jgi:hypothetical protein
VEWGLDQGVPLLRAVEALSWELATWAAATRRVRWCEPARRAVASRQGALVGAGETCCCEPTRRSAGSQQDILIRVGQMRYWARTWAALLGLLCWVRIWAGRRRGGGDRPAGTTAVAGWVLLRRYNSF